MNINVCIFHLFVLINLSPVIHTLIYIYTNIYIYIYTYIFNICIFIDEYMYIYR